MGMAEVQSTQAVDTALNGEDFLGVRVDAIDKRRWALAAEKDERDLSSWVRSRLNRVADEELGDRTLGLVTGSAPAKGGKA